jgi:hypothetical protein
LEGSGLGWLKAMGELEFIFLYLTGLDVIMV